MKKTCLRTVFLTVGFCAGTLALEAQTATGSSASGSGAAGATATGQAAPAGTLNTIGAAGINQPAATPPAGGASVLQTAPNSAPNTGGVTANPPAAGPSATLPSGVSGGAAQAVQFNTLPANVQTVLQGFSADGSLGSVTAVPGQPGTFRATVVQNGVPMEMTIAPNGRIISRTQVTGSPASTPTASTLPNVQAGVPLTSLPPGLQTSIQTQLGGAQVQSISRDDLANGSVFRVTALQNGVPTEMRFAANGTLLSSTPLTAGAATSAFAPGGTIIPGGPLVLEDLPASVQDTVRDQLGEMEASRILQQRATNGVNYIVSYNQDGRPMTMVVGPDGRVISNAPATIGAAGAASRGTASSAAATARRQETITMEDLPDNVENLLKSRIPYAEVRSITRERRAGGEVYVISVRDGDRVGEITLDADGKLIRDTRRDVSELTPVAPPPEEKIEGIPYEELPVAIQNAVKAYASAGDIRSITLGLDPDGRTVYDVIFYRDGQRDRMIIAKSGMLVRMEQNVSPALDLASRKPAVLAIGDLPQQVQDTIRRQTDTVQVKSIQTREVGGETVYQVNFDSEGDGTPMELLVSQRGEVVLPQGDPRSASPGAPLAADVSSEEPDPTRIVDATKPETDDSAAGAFAGAERDTASATIAVDTGAPIAEVKLSETPKAVQNTAKKLAGSSTITRIVPKLGESGVTYEVSFLEDNKPRTVIINRNGEIQNAETTEEP